MALCCFSLAFAPIAFRWYELLIGGILDRHTTVADTERLFAAAREPKELWLISNAAHVDFLEFAGDAYRRRILAFLAAALSRRTG